MDGSRKRSSRLVRVATGSALAIVLAVAFATTRGRGGKASPIDVALRTASAKADRESASIDGLHETGAPIHERSAETERIPEDVPQAPHEIIVPSPVPSAGSGAIAIVGDVRDPSGNGVAAWLTCITTTTKRDEQADTGEFQFEGLEPGWVALDVHASGFRMQTRWIELKPNEVERRVDIVLEPEWILDLELVSSDGRRLDFESARDLFPHGMPDAEPVREDETSEAATGVQSEWWKRLSPLAYAVSPDPPPERWTDGSAAARRAHRLVHGGDARQEGSYARIEIDGEPPLYLSVDFDGNVAGSVRLDTRVDHATIVVSPRRAEGLRSSLTCRVVDAGTRGPLASVRATVSSARGASAPLRIVSDAAGRIRMTELWPGPSLLYLNDRAHAPASIALNLEPGTETDLGTIALDPPMRLRGRFVDAEGRAIAAHGALRPIAREDGFPFELRVDPNDCGRFESTRALAPDLFLLVAWGKTCGRPDDPLLVRSQIVDLRRESIEDLVLKLDPAVPVRIQPMSDAAHDFAYSLLGADRVPYGAGELSEPRLLWLAAGDYTLLVGPDAAHLREIPFTVGTEEVTIPIEP